ncbi:MAG: type II toxin-antitoxin system PemK/MazF family toxin [Planctomycetota bacterium]|jgi:mRNA interferase MazF
MKRGDVVLIRFPFTDLSSTKVRPALIISNENYNSKQDDVVLLLITSNVSRVSPDDGILDSNDTEFKDTGLKQTSAFRVGKIQTLNKKLINSRLGLVGSNTLSKIEVRLRNLLQLP